MALALAEIRRARGRFTAIVAAVALLVVLVLVLAALADGLLYGQTGALRAVRADVLVYGEDADGSLAASQLPADLEARLRGVEGVGDVGGLSVLPVTGEGPGGEVEAALYGFAAGSPGEPALAEGRLPAADEAGVAAIDATLAAQGTGIGDELTLGGERLEIVGLVTDTGFGLQGSVWTSLPVAAALRQAVRPETRGAPPVVNAYALTTDGATAAAVAAGVDEGGGTASYTADEAILADPIVAQQNSILRAVIVATLLVTGLVIALFFALLTLEKRGLFATVKALGAGTPYLATGLVAQAVVATVAGIVLGGLVTAGLSLVIPDAVPTLFRPQSAVVLAAVTVPTAVLGAALSFRRIARIDPATALGGGV